MNYKAEIEYVFEGEKHRAWVVIFDRQNFPGMLACRNLDESEDQRVFLIPIHLLTAPIAINKDEL